jgi:phage/plasmid-like protein (TIGR03299 family)
MSHELDTKADGVAAYFGRQVAWHELGIVMDVAVSVEQALELSGANFDVALAPLFTRRTVTVEADLPEAGDSYDTFDEVTGYKATVRTDRDEILGCVRSRYTPLQNKDAFGILEPLVADGLATIETAGVLRGGRDVWMLVRFDIEDPIVKEVFDNRGDKVVPYGLISNNHAGQRQVQLQETPIRVVCANTLGMAQSSFRGLQKGGKAYAVRHTLTVEAKTTEAARALFGDLIGRYRQTALQYELLRRTHLDTALFRKLVLDIAAPIPKRLDKSKLVKREETSLEQITARRNRLVELWGFGDGNKGEQTAWEAYNAVTQSVDHDIEAWKARGGAVGRAQSLFDGRLSTVKQDVLDSLVTFSAASYEEVLMVGGNDTISIGDASALVELFAQADALSLAKS